ncbi:MAG: hypothetical protein HY587_03835 [Candidatus Omnitrophica bacterium]|nr:hypothetical protein [Candidatus Omnitrophota bacterium]
MMTYSLPHLFRSFNISRRVRRRLAALIAVLFLGTVGLGSTAVPGFAASAPSVRGSVTIVDKEGRPKSNHEGVVVFLDELEQGAVSAAPSPLAHAEIRQNNKQFSPRVLPILAGTTVDFPNDDTVHHNVFSLSRTKPFDLGIYGQAVKKSVTFDQPGLVKIYCNIHPNMVAYLLVLANPYFTVTDSKGEFVIHEVPLGVAIIRAWHSKSRQEAEQKIHVTAEGVRDIRLNVSQDVHFEIQEETISIEHKNKTGQDYPEKY